MNSIRRRLGALRRRVLQAGKASATDRCFIAQSSSIELPLDRNVRRSAPRPQEQREPGYDGAFDATFLFYDIFWRGGEVVMIGPPLRNLSPILDVARIEVDGVAISDPPKSRDLDRVQVSSVPAVRPVGNLGFEAGWVTAQVTVQKQHNDVFMGRKVLFTKSKNNALNWIADWIDFHVRVHEVDAVLIYDNASDRYGPSELLDRMRSIPGILAAVVVPWPYKYGPQGPADQVDWDSDYCQYVMLEHARRRFLADAAAILQIDVDEMVISEDGAGVFEHLARSPVGAVSFEGMWIQSITSAAWKPVRHRNFHFFDQHGRTCPPKWAAIPGRIPDDIQMKVHKFSSPFEATKTPELRYRHFKAVNTDWKYVRTVPIAYDPLRHRVDEAWVRQMQAIGWAENPPK